MENKKEHGAFYYFIQKQIQYFSREELNNRIRLLNALLISVLILEIPLIIMKVILKGDIKGILFQIGIFVLVSIFLGIINKFPQSEIPIIVLAYINNFLVFPLKYFLTGGIHGNTILWMIFGNVFLWMILIGLPRIVGIIADYFMVLFCITTELKNPDIVVLNKSLEKETIEVFVSFLIVTIALGSLCIFMFHLYSKKEEEMREKDNALMDANANLESINVSLSQLSDAKSNFLANMSHEIRTPINAILGMTEMILRDNNDDQIANYASEIDVAGHHLLSMVNDILDYSKLESGKLEIHPVEYELFSVMNDTYNMILPRAKKKQLKFIVENDSNLPAMLYGDEIRVRQIILNLLSNAIKYTLDGYVKISFNFEIIDAENIELRINVKDTGIGISKAEQEKMFESFERVDILNHRDIEGVGVGLSITKRLLNLMGGRISVESQEGVGTEFTVAIPQRIANHSDVVGDFAKNFRQSEYLQSVDFVEELKNQVVVSNIDTPKLDGEEITGAMKLKSPDKKKKEAPFHAPDARLLVVDDVKMNLNVVRLLLKNTDIQIDMAESGAECLNYTMMKHYDIILMDHMMPEMDGIETMHKVKEQKMGLNTDTPIVVLTANAIQNVEEMYRNEGFDDYLSKPVKSDKLEQTLFKYLPQEKVIYTDLLSGMIKKNES